MDKNIKEIELKSFKEFEQIAKKEICENKFYQLTKKILNPQIYYFEVMPMLYGSLKAH